MSCTPLAPAPEQQAAGPQRRGGEGGRPQQPRRGGQGEIVAPHPGVEGGEGGVQQLGRRLAIGLQLGPRRALGRGPDRRQAVVHLADRPDEVEEAPRQGDGDHRQLDVEDDARHPVEDGQGGDGPVGRLAAEQRPGRRGDDDQVGRGEERRRIERVAHQVAVEEAVLAPDHVGHPGAAHHGHVGVDRASPARELAQQRLVEQPAQGEQHEGGDVGRGDLGQDLHGVAGQSSMMRLWSRVSRIRA